MTGWMKDGEAERIRNFLRRSPRPEDVEPARRWLGELLADRRERSALIQRLSRHLHHLRRRLAQAASYFDRLAAAAHSETRRPWPQQVLCDECGAPADQSTTAYNGPSQKGLGPVYTSVTRHVDGRECEKPIEAQRTSPAVSAAGRKENKDQPQRQQ